MIGYNSAHTGRSPFAGPTAPAKWKWTVTPERYFFDSSPAIGADGTIYAYSRDALYAICPDGTLRWVSRFAEWGKAASPALASDGTIYLATGNGTLYAIDPTTGSEKWHFTGVGYPMAPTVGSDGTVYFGTDMAVWGSDTNWDFEYAGYLYAVAPDGTLKWAWKTGRIESSPAIGPDGTVYLTSWDGNLYALDPATGNRKWTFSANGDSGGTDLTSPVVGDDGTIYLGNPDGHLCAVNPDGTQKWATLVRLSGPPFYANYLSPPAIGGDETVYINVASEDASGTITRHDLDAFNADGSLKWSCATAGVPFGFGGRELCSPVVDHDGAIYVVVPYTDEPQGGVGGLYAIGPGGDLKWSFTASTGPSGAAFTPIYPVIAADGTLYVGSLSKELYAFGGTILTPTVTGITPTSGSVGTAVTLTGTGFSGTTAVAFNGAAASFTANSDTQITATVPTGATTGTIAVTTPGGIGTSTATFTVSTPAPTPTPTPAAKVTLKLSGLRSGAMRLGRSVTATGKVTPTSLAGSKVTLTVQLKKGSKWVKAKTASALISSTGAYSWKYKPAKKGAYRVRSAIAKTATHAAAKTKWLAFKVK